MTRTRLLPVATALTAVAAAPGLATAATPSVSTQAPTKVTSTSARLTAKVDPNRESTTYSFQYGTTSRYGLTTPAAPAGDGDRAITARADVVGLKPDTVYHVRVVASNPSGVRSGTDRTFRTAKVPLSLSLGATPNPVPFGAPTTLTGQLAGTGGGERRVQLQQNAFPFTDGFRDSGNPVVTAADGTFSMPVLGLAASAQFRAVVTQPKRLTSPPVVVGVSPIVRTAVTTARPRKGSLVRFAGSVTPQWVPAQVAVQRRAADGRWITVAGTITRAFGPDKSRYARRVRVRRDGTYRIFVGLLDSRYAPSTGPAIRLRVRAAR